VFNILLQVLDDGRLTDGQGRTVDFSNVVIIMTSNLGAEYLLQDLKKNDTTISKATKDKVLSAVKSHFRPEFLNRLDDIVVFNPLSLPDLRKIVTLQLQSLQARLEERDIVLKLSDSGLEAILRDAYNPVYGARPIRRHLEKVVGTNLSRMIIGETLPDHSIVHVEGTDTGLSYRVVPNPNPRSRSLSPKRRKMDRKDDGRGRKQAQQSKGPEIIDIEDAEDMDM